MFIPKLSQIKPAIDKYGLPLYITDKETLINRAKYITKCFDRFDTKIFYAIKTNFNPHIAKVLKDAGIYGIDTVSANEVKIALGVGYKPEQIIFTPSNPSNKDIKYIGDLGVLQNLGSLSELERFGKFFPKNEVSIRICPEVGQGEFDKIKTGQMTTKFGITMSDIPKVKQILAKYDLKLIGIHSHIGSGFYETTEFKASVEAVCKVGKMFENLKFLDFGGGFGVSYHPDKPAIDLSHFAEEIEPIIQDFEKHNGQKIEIRIEPGKFLVSQSTVLCAEVTTIKEKDGETFVGLDLGFGQYIRPAMYGAYQHFVNLSKPNGKPKQVQIVGNVCETCDIFNKGIEVNDPQEGDILAMLVAGGYGAAMSSNYNGHEHLPEVLLEEGGSFRLIRQRQSFEEIMKGFEV